MEDVNHPTALGPWGCHPADWLVLLYGVRSEGIIIIWDTFGAGRVQGWVLYRLLEVEVLER